jgi:purine-cytosine permease-like protein
MSAAHDTQFGVVERRGIELVPESERHGRPRDLFFIWVAANANVFSIVNGVFLAARPPVHLAQHAIEIEPSDG